MDISEEESDAEEERVEDSDGEEELEELDFQFRMPCRCDINGW